MIGVNGYLGFHQNVLDPSNPCSSTVIGKTCLLVVIRWPVLTLDHSHTVMLLRVQLPYTTVCLFTSVSQTSPLARGSGQSFYWSVMPSGGAGTFLQWLACTHVALSATFTAVCVISRTWNGPFRFPMFPPQVLDYHEIARPDIMQDSFSWLGQSVLDLLRYLRENKGQISTVV